MIERYRISEAGFDAALTDLRTYREMPRTAGVYIMVNVPTGRVYVGRSKNMHRRASVHMTELRSGIKDKLMQADFLQHGEESIRFSVLAERKESLEIFWCELQAILIARTRDCYNAITPVHCQTDPEKDRLVRERLALS